MAQATKWKEMAGVLAVVLMLVGLPLLLGAWRSARLAHRSQPEIKIITLTAIAEGGIWTNEEIVGYNYWWRTPSRVQEIPLNQGDHVVVRLRSVDVLHSFGIPLLRLGPVDVPAGHTVETEFTAERPGVLTFLCWQVCSPDHPSLRGQFVVKAGKTEEAW